MNTSSADACHRWDGSPLVNAAYQFVASEKTYKGYCFVPKAYLDEGEGLYPGLPHIDDAEMMRWVQEKEGLTFDPDDLFYWYIDWNH